MISFIWCILLSGLVWVVCLICSRWVLWILLMCLNVCYVLDCCVNMWCGFVIVMWCVMVLCKLCV